MSLSGERKVKMICPLLDMPDDDAEWEVPGAGMPDDDDDALLHAQ